ncbi:ABC transporter permease [Ethanoligenens harbinense]|uniref:Binding-protein-dependent transport systems inner membrane component n=2 Tax=Ethanoligenens harbinense TaxID=253239 RepID=E6U552_ETHHY|nr:ABC transporter permease [Ethanoligenens harbinense]ADU27865.1 binding-protein-dependent transport systems inner membrane component [Ethanoligenens harbinense YUAN-3]AVQ97497.1 ABC transporter permease [Ethanoligenens harbinense YUAN-3]AYF40152.1 ABC transporter permease [Ethanoligenens harbinense]AYF42993.1 ABC transporter permease [Ethanoligenens harbinense]QCN93753.1 ABC transporter permease [Ethanoligenens harbinense]
MLDFINTILEHLAMTAAGVAIAVLIGTLAGIWISRKTAFAGPVLYIADVIQTIPSLALLAILMIVFGLGDLTVIIGLCLYSLLPVIRNTYTGLTAIPPSIREAARGMGMSSIQSLIKVELPLAVPMILSGIRIAFVTALGTAVIGVLIGSGGLGYIIYRGIQALDWGMIIEGTIPVVLLSLLAQYVFNKLQRLEKRRKINV